MPDPVLLQGLHIQDSDFSRPHTGNSKQYHFITPKISSKQQMQVLSVRQRRGPPSDLPQPQPPHHIVTLKKHTCFSEPTGGGLP